MLGEHHIADECTHNSWFWGHGGEVWAKKLTCFRTNAGYLFIAPFVSDLPGDAVMISDFNRLRRIYMDFPTPMHTLVSLPYGSGLVDEAERFVALILRRPYLAVHLRRTDFLQNQHTHGRVHPIDVVVAQARDLMSAHGAEIVFIATDADQTDQEYPELGQSGLELYRYPNGKGLYAVQHASLFGDGQVAVIEQIICARAAVFLGTTRSAYSARIVRDRYEARCMQCMDRPI